MATLMCLSKLAAGSRHRARARLTTPAFFSALVGPGYFSPALRAIRKVLDRSYPWSG